MGQRQQPDHGSAGPLLGVGGQQRLEGALIGAAREELLTVDQIEQRHRLATQSVDDVPVIDDVAVLAARMRATAAQAHQRRRTEKAFEPIIVEPHAQPMPDQPRGHRVEHLAQAEAAARRDGDDRLLVIGRPVCRQRLQGRTLEIETLAVARIAPPDDLVDEAAIDIESGKIARPAQQQRVLDRLFEMAVGAFDRPVLDAPRRDCCGSAPCRNARTKPHIGASDPAACRRRDCGRRPTSCRCDAARERARAPTTHSAIPRPAPRSSRRRARHGRAPSRRRPAGSDRADDPGARRRC